MKRPQTLTALTATALLIGGAIAALWFIHRRLDPFEVYRRNPPQIASVEVIETGKPNGPIQLAGPTFQALFGQMFYGFRDDWTWKQRHMQDARWVVTITDTDRRKRSLSVWSENGKSFWTRGTRVHETYADLDLLLGAKRGIELLDVGHSADYEKVEAAVAADGNNAIDPLIELSYSRDAFQRMTALRGLNFLISARVRRALIDSRGIISKERPAESGEPNDHPRAADVRAVAMGIIKEWNGEAFPISEGSWLSSAALPVAVELADRATIEALVEMLRARPDADREAEQLMLSIEAIYGLPPFVDPMFICATGETATSLAWAAKEALVRSRERRKLLLAWYDAHGGAPYTERLQLAVSAWEPRIAQRDLYPICEHSLLLRNEYVPLLRHGVSVVPFLRAAQSRVPNISHRASYEMLIALITARYDASLVVELQNGDAVQREIAHSIFAISRPAVQ